MKIVVAGLSGFLGKRWLSSFAKNGEIIALGRSLPDGAGSNVTLVECNLSEPGALAKLIVAGGLPKSVDAIVHIAVSRLHRTFPETAIDLFEVNTAATAYLLDYARQVGASRFVLGSTGSVYDGMFNGLLKEGVALAPHRYFPASKHAAELLTHGYRPIFPVAALRFFTPYGPGQTDRLVPDIINRIRTGKPVTLPQTGEGIILATTYIDDAAAVLDRSLRESWNEEVNVANPEFLSLGDAARVIGEVVGQEPKFERVNSTPAYSFLPDLERLSVRFDLGSLVKFKEGVRRIVSTLPPV